MEKKISLSVLRAIFIRKGSIGEKTILIAEASQDLLDNQYNILNVDETAIICYTYSETDWVLLTDSRLIMASNGNLDAIDYVNIKIVSLTHFGILSKRKDITSQVFIEDNQGKKFSINIETGRPLFGIYQVLSYIASCNQKG